MEVEPAATVEEAAYLDHPHGVIHVGEGLGGLGPMVGKKLRHDHKPSEPQKERYIGRSRGRGNGGHWASPCPA
jgi:hypothetical protein